MDMAVQHQEVPLSKDVEALMQSSVVGAELFATEARKEETRAYAQEIDEIIYNLEMEDFKDELTFKRIMAAFTETLDVPTWESFVDNTLHVSLVGHNISTVISNANDSWQHQLDARMKTVAISSCDVPRLPWEVWLFGETGLVPGAPETVHVPEEMTYDVKNARDYLLSVLPDGFITAEQLKEQVKANLTSLKRTDRSFWLEEAFFLHGPFDEAITGHLRNCFLGVMPDEGQERSINKDVLALRTLVHGDVVSAQKATLVKELKTAHSLVVDCMECRGFHQQKPANSVNLQSRF